MSEDLITPTRENDDDHLLISINANLHQTSQSLNELAQLAVKTNTQIYKQNPIQHITSLPARMKVTANSTSVQNTRENNQVQPYLNTYKQSLPEPTRINRRTKSSRGMQASASLLSMDNIKQQHRLTSTVSIQSSKSLSLVRRHLSQNDSTNENHYNQNLSWCCHCCFPSLTANNPYSIKTKPILSATPTHSLTHDDDDEDKISSNDTTTRTAIYTSAPSSGLTRRSVRSSAATPGDVHRRERIRFMKEQKTAKTLAVVVGGFILLWLPFFIMYVIPAEKHSLDDQTITLITWLGYFNSVINPFIYAYCSKQFRMAFWNITFGMFIKRPSGLLPITNKNKQSHKRNIVV